MKKTTMKRKKALRIAGNVLRYAVLALLALAAGISLYSVCASAFGGESFPMPFGVGSSVVLTGSMEPEISVDDLIIVKRSASFEVGDVVVYQSGRSSVVHRLIEIDGDRYVTKGDANNAEDDPIKISDIKGKVVKVIPGVGRIVKYVRTPGGVIALVILALLVSELSFALGKKRSDSETEGLKKEIDELKKQK